VTVTADTGHERPLIFVRITAACSRPRCAGVGF